MKYLLLLLCCSVLGVASVLPAQPAPKVLVQIQLPSAMEFENRDKVVGTVENVIQSRINREFPCARVTTRHSIQYALDGLRQLALNGKPGDDNPDYQKDLAALGDLMNVDHLVMLQVTPMGGQWVLNGKWLDQRKVQALARNMETIAPNAAALTDAAGRIADRLVDDAAYFEICPYTGPVKITVHSTRSARPPPETRPVECKGMGGEYVKTTTVDWMSDTTIDLTRTGRVWTTGNIGYNSIENEEIEEMDPCHLCPNGSRGLRLYTEHKRTEIRISGFSDQSSAVDAASMDVRLYLKFAKNGTYRLEFKSSTKQGSKQVKIDRKAEGVCDTKFDKPREESTGKFEVAPAHIFGPFQGTPFDKMLSAKQEFRTTDPVTKEESTIVVDFTLQRQ